MVLTPTKTKQQYVEVIEPFKRIIACQINFRLYLHLERGTQTGRDLMVLWHVCVVCVVCVVWVRVRGHQIIEMIKEIREVFINNLEQLTWMDKQTKEAAKQKVLVIKHVNGIHMVVFVWRSIEENMCIFPPFLFLRPKLSGNKSAMMTKFWMMNTSTASTVMYEGSLSSALLTGSTEAVTGNKTKQVVFLKISFIIYPIFLLLVKLQYRWVLWEHFTQLWALAEEALAEAPSESQQREVS